MDVTTLDLPQLDYTDPELRGDEFHRRMKELSEQNWLAQAPLGYVVLDREACEFFLRSKQAEFPGLKLAELFDITEGPLHEEIVENVISINGDDHRRLRSLVNPALSTRAVQKYRPQMRKFLEELEDAAAATGDELEFVDAFAKPYPSFVIANVMGAPLSYAEQLHGWSNEIQRQFDVAALASDRQSIEDAVAEFYEFAEGLIADRRSTPSDDLISDLISAEEAGEKLSPKELRNLILNILVGGVDTSQSQLAHTIRLLAQHPEQWEALRADPERLGPAAVEEGIRFEPITPFTARITIEEVEYRGVTIPKDTVLMICAFTGNRDPQVVSNPDQFDIERQSDTKRLLTFGAGIHYCVGANLARAELNEAMQFLAERWERIELAGEPKFQAVTGVYGMESLPLKITRA